MEKIHLDKVGNFVGFAVENAAGGEKVMVLGRASITSDEPEFYTYIEYISNVFFNKVGVFANNICKFLVVIHKDVSADLYINDFQTVVDIRVKRAIQKGEYVMQSDITDIGRMEFPDIEIIETDKVICCFKVGWKFGLFFDLDRRENLDTNKMFLALGELYRNLSFQYVYKVLESRSQFEEMMRDGWFPFIEIIGREYKTLTEAYQNKFAFADRIQSVVNSFGKDRIEKITSRWWKAQIFIDKQPLIEAGVSAYLAGNNHGFVNCIKTLLPEIEGILRQKYFEDTGKGKNVKVPDLLEHLVGKGRVKSGSDDSLFLPLPFFKYLSDVVFANFDLESGKVDLSRHSSSHGVARPDDYTRVKALQMILILDQIYFYIG